MIVTAHSVTVSKPEIDALIRHALKGDEERAHLCSVTFDLGAGRAFASDGHRAIVARSQVDRVGDGLVAVVPRAALERASRMTPRTGSLEILLGPAPSAAAERSLGWPKGLVSLQARDADGTDCGATSCQAADVQPVPLDQVVPRPDALADRCAWVRVNASYLADLDRVQRAAGATGIVCWAGGEKLSPVLFECQGTTETHWTIVVMPMLGDGDGDAHEGPVLHAAAAREHKALAAARAS